MKPAIAVTANRATLALITCTVDGAQMAHNKDYKLSIRSKYLGEITQTWTWYGEMKGDLKALLNYCDYATDVRVYIDSGLNIAGGPSHLVNPDSIITVTEI